MKDDSAVGFRPRVVVVEDEVVVAMDVEMQLTQLGYEVVGTADKGMEALQLIRTAKPDVVLMDINLRGFMDGIAVASELQQSGSDVPIILVTAYGSAEASRRVQTARFSGYLTKPYRSQELREAIHNALQQ